MNSTIAHVLYTDTLHHPLLDKKTERRLLSQAQAGDMDALNFLAEHNQRLIYKESQRAWRKGLAGDLDMLDLAQFGNIGLLMAIRKFDLSTPYKLSTYAVPWIRQAIERGARAHGHPLGVGINKSLHLERVRRVAGQFYQQFARWPTPAELVEHSGLSAELVTEASVHERAVVHSLEDEVTYKGREYALLETLADENALAPDAEAEARLETEGLHQALAALPELLRRVLELRYGLNDHSGKRHNYREIGALVGCSRTWAQKLEQDALTLLASTFAGDGL